MRAETESKRNAIADAQYIRREARIHSHHLGQCVRGILVITQQWQKAAGGKAAGALTAGYVAAFAGSHPLAKKVGAWPAVFGVAGVVALASWVVADRKG